MTASDVLTIIPARGGSKRLPRKNLAPLGGRPLLAWSIESARAATGIGRCIVSSDDDDILAIATQLGAETMRRSAASSSNEASSADVVNEILARLAPWTPGIVLLLQPTSPFRRPEQIDTALELLAHGDTNAVIGVCRPQFHPLKALKLDNNGYLTGLVDHESPFLPRQSLPEVWQPNGAIYAVRTAAFLTYGFMPPHTLPLLMDEKSSIDIDDADDLQRAKRWIGELPQ